jgi:hypothetical protein
VEDSGTVTTLEQGLALFETVGMPARNLSARTRREYGGTWQTWWRF